MSENETVQGNPMRKKRSVLRKILIGLGITIGVILLFAIGVIGWLTITEYRPEEREGLTVTPAAGEASLPAASTDREITLMTWNIGYGALGDNADFFMDGGSEVYTADEERVNANLGEILGTVREVNPDILFVQEIDEDCSRSYGIDEIGLFSETLNRDLGRGFQSTFAYNFKVKYVPYPLPPIGRVYSGIQTLSAFRIGTAERVKLPSPFKWPVSVANLKRCVTIHRCPVEGSEHELVLINLHLEAYDSGEGKIEQTKILKSILEEEVAKGNYVIAGGDFNQTFSNVDVSAYPQQEGKWECGKIDVSEYSKELSFLTDASAPTCRSLDRALEGADRATFQYYVVDGFVVSSNVEAISVRTIDLKFHATDHNPVVLKVKLCSENQ